MDTFVRSVPSLALFTAVAFGCSSPEGETANPGGTGGVGTGGSGVSGSGGMTGGMGQGGASGSGGTGGVAGANTSGSGGAGGAAAGTGGVGNGGKAGAPMGGGGNANAGGSQGGMGTGGSDAAGASGASASSGAGGAAAGTGGGAGSGTGGSGGAMQSSGCGSTTMPQDGNLTIDVDGTMREYILALPDDYDPNHPYRLIFGWHPLGGSAQQVASGGYYGLEGQADGDAIFVAAEGLPFQGNSLGWANTGGRDLAFLEAMLDRFRSELCIDESRIFSTGFSFGGMMSFAVGCATNGVMRAIAPQAGNIQVSGCEDGTRPVAVMGFHGTEDTVVQIDGGRAGRDVFVERNGCTEQTMPSTSTWCDGISQEPCSCVSYQGCMEGYPVTWCEFNGPHTPAPNSATTIWNFFASF